MKAKLEPLKGKYYRTTVRVTDAVGNEHTIEITTREGDEFVPSDRELAALGVSRSQWDGNRPVRLHPDSEEELPCREACNFEGSHTERQSTYLLARAIMEALNAPASSVERERVEAPMYAVGEDAGAGIWQFWEGPHTSIAACLECRGRPTGLSAICRLQGGTITPLYRWYVANKAWMKVPAHFRQDK